MVTFSGMDSWSGASSIGGSRNAMVSPGLVVSSVGVSTWPSPSTNVTARAAASGCTEWLKLRLARTSAVPTPA